MKVRCLHYVTKVQRHQALGINDKDNLSSVEHWCHVKLSSIACDQEYIIEETALQDGFSMWQAQLWCNIGCSLFNNVLWTWPYFEKLHMHEKPNWNFFIHLTEQLYSLLAAKFSFFLRVIVQYISAAVNFF